MGEGDYNVTKERYIPNVVEPSFGLGRIISALLEHSFKYRHRKHILDFRPEIAPVKASIIPIFNKEEFIQYVPRVERSIRRFGLSVKTDKTSVSLGKKYGRYDEIGIPYSVTIDHTTLEEEQVKTVTLREIYTTNQVRVPIDEIGKVIS